MLAGTVVTAFPFNAPLPRHNYIVTFLMNTPIKKWLIPSALAAALTFSPLALTQTNDEQRAVQTTTRDGFNPGWLGLFGLVGLFGLRKKNSENVSRVLR